MRDPHPNPNQVRRESPTLHLTLFRLHYKDSTYIIADGKHASAKDKQAFSSAYLSPALVGMGCTLKRVLAGTGPRVCA